MDENIINKIEDDEEDITELEMWKSTLKRYNKIDEALYELNDGISSDGSKKLNIPTCIFCEIEDGNCNNCQWGKIFGDCNDDSSLYGLLYNSFSITQNIVNNITNKIKEQINNMEQN